MAERRFVVFIGPPKTASTSLEYFLADHVNKKKDGDNTVDAFQSWNYPLFLGYQNGLRELRIGRDPDAARGKIRKTFQKQDPDMNLVVGSEYFIQYPIFLNGRLFEVLANWTGRTPEIVLQSRSPRTSHLISCWKQASQVKGKPSTGLTFRQMLCNTNKRIESITRRHVSTYVNPLGMALGIIQKYGISTTVLDMTGIAEQGMDVCHAFACSVLKVNCTSDGKWVQGLEGTVFQDNSRFADPGISKDEIQQMEQVFLQRDCAYYEELYNESNFHLFYRHSGLWPEDCANIQPMYQYRYNETLMLDTLRGIIGCSTDEQRKNRSKNSSISIPFHGGNQEVGNRLVWTKSHMDINQVPKDSYLIPWHRFFTFLILACAGVVIHLYARIRRRLYARHRQPTTAVPGKIDVKH